MLEILVHSNIGRIPTNHRFVTVEIPEGISVERVDGEALPSDWDAEHSASAAAFGDRWLDEARSAILIVPSVIARYDANVLVNPVHPEAARLRPSAPEEVRWDRRLFERGLTQD